MVFEGQALRGREWIEARIPHREPFLFVDRVLELTADSILTEWSVPMGADFFRGHYPGEPVLPGVIASEFVFQSGALLVGDAVPEAARSIPVLARVQDARFRRMVRPGEHLTVRVTLEDQVGSAFMMKGEIRNELDESVLRLRFTVAMKERGI